MLGAWRYLLGVAELGVLVGFAWFGALALRRRLVPMFGGAPAHLTTALLAIALLLWIAELLGAVGLLEAVPYLVAVVVVGVGIGAFNRGRSPRPAAARGRGLDLATLVALAIAAVAIVHFAAGVRVRLSTGMTGFDSTWYHGPFAAGFFQSGDTWGLHFIAPQFLAWFYPANSEVVHAVGMLAFGRDVLSPLLNLGWFVGCLVAAWCIGRPYRVGPFSLALGAVALSVPALSDQAGEARNDIVGIFFLLAAVAVAVNAWAASEDSKRLSLGAVAVAGLAAGLAAGTKLNFLLPCAVLVVGLAFAAAPGVRLKTLVAGGLAALAGGGYWYLRNLAHTGNPLPWVKHLGPIELPAPEQALGGREGHSVLGYLSDGSVWSDWFLPGLHHGLTVFWPLLVALAVGSLLLCLGRGADPTLRVASCVGLAAALAWLVAPTSASGPDGMPHGFESGLRYLAPALILALALALAPAAPASHTFLTHFPRLCRLGGICTPNDKVSGGRWVKRGVFVGAGLMVFLGYPVQRHYLRDRYADPSFSAPGLNATFAWSRDISDARIATTSTRQYPLFGTDLSNHVDYIGTERPHGGFTAPRTCPEWRRLLNAGHYDYAVTTRDRIESNKPTYPPTTRWTEGPGATVILRKPPTVIYQLRTPLDPSKCRR
jgi:hypothetical protein